MPRYSDADLLDEIRRVADLPDVDGVPSEQTFTDESDISSRTVRRRFGSWRAAIDAAGLGPYTQADKIPRDKLIAELRWLRDEVDQIPTADQMDDHGAYAYITYYERFGSWGDALEAAFGEAPDREWEHVSDAELIAELQRLADANDGERPTTVDVEERGAHATTTYRDRFGSWADALDAAGFEPPPPQRVTTEELLAELRRLHDEFGGRPTTTLVREHGSYSRQTYYNRFGSWDDALAAAFETVPTDTPDADGDAEAATTTDSNEGGDEETATTAYSDEDLLDEIRRVADVADSDGAPSISEFDEYSDIADSTIYRRFGSWNAGVERAGFEPRQGGTTISDAELATELQRLRDEVCHAPTKAEMDAQGAYAAATYENRFGSWTAAIVETFDDVTPPLSARDSQPGAHLTPGNPDLGPHVSTEDLLADLQTLADELGRSPTSKDMREHGTHSTSTYMRRFDSWTDALEAAGLDTPDRNKIPDADLIADLYRLRDELGRVPTATDVVEEGTHGIATYQRHFGSWSEALDAAGIETEPDGPSDDELLADLHRLHDERDKVPSLLDVQDDGQYTEKQYRNRFGSWREALDAAGFDPDRGPTDAELLAELHRLRDELEKRPSMNDMTDHGAYGCSTYQRRFGSWSAALEEAFDTESVGESRGSE